MAQLTEQMYAAQRRSSSKLPEQLSQPARDSVKQLSAEEGQHGKCLQQDYHALAAPRLAAPTTPAEGSNLYESEMDIDV